MEHPLIHFAGAFLALFASTVALTSWRRFPVVVAPGHRRHVQPSRSAVYADIDDVIDALDDIARENRWDLAKRLAIARLACENRTAPLAALEQRYDRDRRASFASSRSGDGFEPAIV